MLKVFIDRQGQVHQIVHLLIVRFEINGCDLPTPIKKMLNNIASCDSEEVDVLIIQLPQVRVFNGVDDLVLEGFVHCDHILVDYPSLIMLKLELFS